ncbi:hypothetical protein CPLU01_01978 [Colletotrichum plurivorum]|uniref:Uncharacterized protein n=1 Tax=Colletotrichum plurivorum TaxID=2175906 RepID=A0A8H6NNH1_9PEZI|nr:hypothetical protein CPLU01_01978 [Colletotrichum plurivorum]
MRRRNEMTDGPWSHYERAPECLSGPDSLAKTVGSTFLPKGYQCDETSPLKSLGHLLAQSPDPDSPTATAQRKFAGWTPPTDSEGGHVEPNDGRVRLRRVDSQQRLRENQGRQIPALYRMRERRHSAAACGMRGTKSGRRAAAGAHPRIEWWVVVQHCSVQRYPKVDRAKDGEEAPRYPTREHEDNPKGWRARSQDAIAPDSMLHPSSPAVKVSSRLSLRTAAGLWTLESNRTWTGKGTGQGPQRLQRGPGAVRGKARQGRQVGMSGVRMPVIRNPCPGLVPSDKAWEWKAKWPWQTEERDERPDPPGFHNGETER